MALQKSLRILFGAFIGLAASSAFADADRDQAMTSLKALGAAVQGSSGRCASCHSVNLFTLRKWSRTSDVVFWRCLDDSRDPNRAAISRVDCMRSDPANPESTFEPGILGFYAAGSHLPYFSNLFRAAYPAETWEAKYAQFQAQVQMPVTGENRMSDADFANVVEWSKKGLPYLETILGEPGDAPTTCQAEIKPELIAHVRAMQTQGWEAKNVERGLMMFGCSNGATKLGCFDQKSGERDVFPEASTTAFGTNWNHDFPEAKFRVLREIPFRTDYWMRSSADGRFFANGNQSGDDGGMISDLQNQLVDGAGYRDIPARASYDPGFFPDNSGFIFQGTSSGTKFCSQSLLENMATRRILFNEPECASSGQIELYQAIGASLDGSDYLAISGSFESDNGGARNSGDNLPTWFERSYLDLTPVINDGQRYKTMGMVQKWMPFLGDWGLSPSNLLTSSRVSGYDSRRQPKQQGIKFHLVEKTRTVNGYEFSLREAGTVCVDGNKGAFSFDERFYTVYHYVDADDWRELGFANANVPEFKELLRLGSANVYVVDLLTGVSRRVTRMGPGQYALFPHYRSDGWLYFMAVDSKIGKRFIVATDGGIRMEQGGTTH